MDRVKEEKLFDGALNVVVSQQVEIFTIQQNIANQLGLTLDVGDLATRAYKIRRRLTDTKHTPVVLDDIWERLKLEDLGIPCKNTFGGCKILFTSRDRGVLEAMDTQNIFGVSVLSDNEAWSLFREKTNNCADKEDLRSVAENVAKECKGWPVAKELSDVLFDEIRGINVLSMTGIEIKSLPTTTQLLINLKTLLLFSCGIESISVVGELSKLEVLCCRECDNITTLPLEIGRLNCLRLLEIMYCRNFRTTVTGIISSLVSLEELRLQQFLREATESNVAENLALVEIEALTRLSRLEIGINDVNFVAQEICLPPNVEKYRIAIAESGQYAWLDFSKTVCLEIPKEIIVGKWIKKLLRNTECLCLQGDGANLVNFAELENVKYLYLEACSSMKKLVNTFHLLEYVVLHNLENLEEIIPSESNNIDFFRNLRELEIYDCPRLRYLFPVSTAINGSLSQLEKLRVGKYEALEDIRARDPSKNKIYCLKIAYTTF